MATRMADALPESIDCVVGIPRSGLIFANVIANLRGLPLSTPASFCRGELWQSETKALKPSIETVLLVDDMATTGEQIRKARDLIASFKPKVKVLIACLLISPMVTPDVDRYYQLMKPFHSYFTEWNFAHAAFKGWGPVCTDLDGVLCFEDDEDSPKIIPNFRIDSIITSRSFERRAETESWLLRNNVSYDKLFMGTRLTAKSFTASIDHKVAVIRSLKATPVMFWESSRDQAIAIASASKVPVFSLEDRKLYRA